MSLLSIIIILVVLGIALYAINSYIPMQGDIKKILNVMIVIFVVIWLLKIFGVWAALGRMHL